jgi:hypothetical protein
MCRVDAGNDVEEQGPPPAHALELLLRLGLLAILAVPLPAAWTRNEAHAADLSFAWQQELAERWPDQLLKGLIQSDGCRFINTGRGGWRQPRYVFSNVSTDITNIFCSACDCLGLRWTAAFPKSETAAVAIYVSRKADVAKLDEFVGPKR